MKNLENINALYFLGIGGIGMSGLARYFHSRGYSVAGYDLVRGDMALELENLGIDINYNEDPENIGPGWTDEDHTLVVYTPAVPREHKQMKFFRNKGFIMLKRSEVLGLITRERQTYAVAGTHGKTSVSTLLAHIFNLSETRVDAFLGGVSKNFNSNVLISEREEAPVVVEADEFDRSFLKLSPAAAIITSMDPDHLDIYGDHQNLKRSFAEFIDRIHRDGLVLVKKGLDAEIPDYLKSFTYSATVKDADYHLADYRQHEMGYQFDLSTPEGIIIGFRTQVPGKINLENAVAALAMSHLAGVKPEVMKKAMESFEGVKRRFDIIANTERYVFIDDYAHHPEELKAFILSVKESLPGKRLTGIFQPHLFSRTRDFAEGFASSLSLLDDVILIPIYPAREKPIAGVNSEMILENVKGNGVRISITEEELETQVKKIRPEVLLTMGAGDIDLWVSRLNEIMREIYEEVH